MNTFTLLHGSKQIVEVPDLAFGNDYNDYGRGFYCAKVEAMAKHRRYSVSFLHLSFRVKFIIQRPTNKLCHSHAVIPQVLTDLCVKVGVNPHGDPFLSAVRHCSDSFPNSF